MTEDQARILAFNRRLNEISGNASKPGTRIIDVMDADTITVAKSKFFDVKWRLLIIVKHLPQFVDGCVLGKYQFTRRNRQEKQQQDCFHMILNRGWIIRRRRTSEVDRAGANSFKPDKLGPHRVCCETSRLAWTPVQRVIRDRSHSPVPSRFKFSASNSPTEMIMIPAMNSPKHTSHGPAERPF